MIKAALKGELADVEYRKDPYFNLEIPLKCPDVPNAVLNPRDTWRNEEEYDQKASELAQLFIDNFKQFEDQASDEILSAQPNLNVEAGA